MSDDPLLEVRDLVKHYPLTEGFLRREVGSVRAVDGISFDIHRGETFGLVGESGCGKSTTARSLLRLDTPTSGTVRFDGEDVGTLEGNGLREYRRRVQFIMQDPESAFNPRMTVGEAVGEPLRIHGMTDSDRRRLIVEDALERIGLSASAADGYPHEFSGGEKQRIALARALVLNPDLIIADEPTSSLDGRTKTSMLRLLNRLQETYEVSVLLISHDIDVVSRVSDRVAVMYLGTIVERGPMDEVVSNPRHPYTRALISSIPSLDPTQPATKVAAQTLTDTVPDASDIPTGCRFHPRCSAIIPPEDLDLSQEEWIGMVRLKFSLNGAWMDAETFMEGLETAPTLEQAVRQRFELPQELADERAESVLVDAVKALERDDLAMARQTLESVVSSVCEREEPNLSEAETDYPVACHRYDPAISVESTPFPDRG